MVPKVDKVEDYIDIKASNILMDSDKYRYIEYIFFLYIGIMELNELFMLLFRLGEFSVAKFTKRIEQLGFDKFPDFSKYGKMTFFLPIDQAFGVSKN